MTADMTALELFQSHYEQLRAFIARNGVSPQDINDLLQEVFLRLHKVKNRAAISEPAAYLFAIARNVVADHFRQRLPDAATFGYAQTQDECIESPALEYTDESGMKLLAALEPWEQAVFIYRHRQGLRYKEIGRLLNFSEHTVRKYLSRAEQRLKQLRESGNSQD